MLDTENQQSLIDSGEGYNAEFKVRIPSKVRELTEETCAFANADLTRGEMPCVLDCTFRRIGWMHT